MRVNEFIRWVSDCEKQYGSRPGSVTLNPNDVGEIFNDLMSDMDNLVVHEETDVSLDLKVQKFQARRPGYSMTLVGVDVYRSADVPVGTYRLD